MAQFEIHTIAAHNEDLGVMAFDNGELAVYPTAKIAQRVADGMNEMLKIKSRGTTRHEYVVVRKEV